MEQEEYCLLIGQTITMIVYLLSDRYLSKKSTILNLQTRLE